MMRLKIFTRKWQPYHAYENQHSITRSFPKFLKAGLSVTASRHPPPVLAAAADVVRSMETATPGAGDKKGKYRRDG